METWLAILSLIKGLFDAIQSGVELEEAIDKSRKDRDTQLEAERITSIGTFSQGEIEAILRRLEGCRDRYIKQGGGQERADCLCSVLNEVIIANGGSLPNYDNWYNIYNKLGCSIS